MKDLTLFYLDGCPYCNKARTYMSELCEENTEYAQIPVKWVEERQESALANSHDYFYVPCYYIEGEKIAEGAIDKAGVKAVLDKALK